MVKPTDHRSLDVACIWPWVTIGLMLLTFSGYLMQHLHPGGVAGMVGQWGCNPSLIVTGVNFPQSALPAWLGVLSATFMHSTWLHLLGNLSVLAILGIALERVLGHRRTFLLYVATGVFGISAMVLTLPTWDVAICGASVVAAGIWAAWLVQPRTCLAKTYPFALDSVGWQRMVQLLFLVVVGAKVVFVALGWFGYSVMNLANGAGLGVFSSVGFCGHLYGAAIGAVLAGLFLACRARLQLKHREATAA